MLCLSHFSRFSFFFTQKDLLRKNQRVFLKHPRQAHNSPNSVDMPFNLSSEKLCFVANVYTRLYCTCNDWRSESVYVGILFKNRNLFKNTDIWFILLDGHSKTICELKATWAVYYDRQEYWKHTNVTSGPSISSSLAKESSIVSQWLFNIHSIIVVDIWYYIWRCFIVITKSYKEKILKFKMFLKVGRFQIYLITIFHVCSSPMTSSDRIYMP